MGVQNSKNCSKTFGNTGSGDCWNDIGIPRGIIFVPINKEYTSVSIAAFKAALEADLLADNASLRAYPIQNIVVTTDNTAEPTVTTFTGDGSIAIGFEPNQDMTFQWTQGGFCLLHALRKSKGQNRAFMVIDSNGQLIATQGSTADTVKGIVGYNYTNPAKWAVGTDNPITIYNTRLSFRPEQVNESIAILGFKDDGGLAYLTALSGLQDVVLTQAAARAAGVFNVKAKTDCGSVDLYDVYPTELAVVGAWKVVNKTTGNVVTITAVAANVNTHGWTITVDTVDPDYTATAGGLLVSFSGPTELDALNVTGYESNQLAQ